MSKEKTLYILKQYQSHCETTIDDGMDTDIENLQDVTEAIEWVEDQELSSGEVSINIKALNDPDWNEFTPNDIKWPKRPNAISFNTIDK